MFRFGEPNMFYLLLLIPVIVVVYILSVRARRKRIERFGKESTLMLLMPEMSTKREMYKFLLYLVALVLLVFGLARPQIGSKLKEVAASGVEIMFVVDVSNSMLAQDFEPNRLERTKHSIGRLIEKLDQDKIGLIVFAGEAYVQLPITSDYVTARSFIKHISPNMITRQGTAIGSAIELATSSFSSDSEGSRVIILISDGENHEDDAIAAANVAAQRGVKIYSIGVGTPEGTFITIAGQYMTDVEGNNVVTKLDEATLQEIALATGGAYIRATNQSMGLNEIVEKVNEMDKAKFSSYFFEEYNEQYHFFLGAALLLLTLEYALGSRKNPLLGKINVFNK